MTTETGDYYSLMPTKFPELCTTSLSPEQNQTFATIEYLYRNGIISTWPNFTNCLPQCGICTSFATDHTYMIYNLVMIGLLLPFISLCGLIGNSLSAFIYSRPRMRSSTNLYFCCLACSDIAVICTALILFFVDSIRRYSLQLSIIYGVFASVAYPAGLIAQTCSVYFTLAAAIDCFIQVCLPEKCKRFFSRVGCFQIVSAFVVIFSISYNVPRFFENIAFECWHSRFDSNSMEVCPTPLRYNDTYLYIYFYVMYTLFLAVGPLVVLIILNTCIIFASVFLKRGKTEDNISLVKKLN
uniref:G-protein coupled receptors family 1 profile domain-containing protein n=1 Tax=Panagrolaimus sp. ES5 TaxID=591445 RepID=A0AC34G5B4_9BILA